MNSSQRRGAGAASLRARALVVVAAWAAIVAAFAAAPADAGQTLTFSTVATISRNAPYFHGRTHSGTVCQRNRRVKLFKKRSGPDRKLGARRSNRRGRWKISARPRRGKYYVKVKAATRRRSGTTYVCRRDRSRTIRIN